ncbi:MAG: helix-turn-helix domain-containing protein [Deltaproteobacteria bacterium]|nr:helix-turn-helix domain-containing protein [Deltaproteobacteria bacterium]MBI3294552.1 helix-turn-helix domain-containing protein [Deltaproteobacteria bacterium]
MLQKSIGPGPCLILKHELERRKRKNPAYSLRGFARALGLSHTLVSHLISGKRAVSKKTAEKIARLIPLTQKEMANLGLGPPCLQSEYGSIALRDGNSAVEHLY